MKNYFKKFLIEWNWKNVLQYFLQGLIIIAPITITLYAVLSLFSFIDNILPNFFHYLFPDSYDLDDKGNLRKIPGLGFILVVVVVMLIGFVSSSFIVSKLVDFLGHILEKTPGIKFIYSPVKDFLEAFAGNKRKFDKPVLVNVDGEDIWRIGFMTQAECSRLGMADHAAVYVPHSYAISGIVYLVPHRKIKLVDDLSSADAMKFTVSGGVTEVEHKIHE